jgi:hypothetical protein
MDSSGQLPNEISVESQQGEDSLKTLLEIISFAPILRFFSELGIVGICFFGLMELQNLYDFPPSAILIPTIAYTFYQIYKNYTSFKSSLTPSYRSLYYFSLINWISLALYQVLLYVTNRFSL